MLLILPSVIQISFANDPIITTGNYTVDCKGSYYDITYQISNAVVTSMTTDSNLGLSASIRNSTNGIITIYFPRQYMDVKIDNIKDDLFFILADNEELNIKSINDKSNSTHRILTLHIPDGTSELEIIAGGTPESMMQVYKPCTVIPEFGYLTFMIVSISIIGVILIQKLSVFKS